MARTALLVLALTLASPAVGAQEEAAGSNGDKDRAAQLFAEAQALSQVGSHAEACRKLEESVNLHEGIGNRFHLADCFERVGRTASAYALFLGVADTTHELGQADREAAARERAEALVPKLTRLRIEVSADKKLVVERDGEAVSRSDWGRPVPVDPGKHEFRATAPGKEPWSRLVEIPGEPGTVIVSVPELSERKAAAAPVAKPAEPEPASTNEPPTDDKGSGGSGRTILTLGFAGLGVAGLAVGGVMTARYYDKHGQAQDVCPTGVNCTSGQIQAHTTLVEDERSARNWAFISASAGVVSLGAAAFLWLTDSDDESAAIEAHPMISGTGSFGAAVSGRF